MTPALIARAERATPDEQGKIIRDALYEAHKSGRISDGPYDRAMIMWAAGAYESAVLIMIPVGWRWDVGNDSDTGGWAEVYHPEHAGKHSGGVDASTPALALLAAIGRASQNAEHETQAALSSTGDRHA